jgi:serine protease Do
MRNMFRTAIGVVAVLAFGALLVHFGLLDTNKVMKRVAPKATSSANPAPSEESEPAKPPQDFGGVMPQAGKHSRFALLAEEAAPGVVNVQTSRTVVQNTLGFPGLPFPDLFHGFFGEPPGGPGVFPHHRQELVIPSLGTGFVISADGEILTNNHVVDGVDKINVIFSDGGEYKAEIVGQDPKTDIALIRVKGRHDLHPLPLGDSDQILPGDWVIAIGNPFGLDHTVTAGILSAKGRDIGEGPYDNYLQTDAAMNPGNSGGPLLDITGSVIGINTAINPQANTIGFAVPINMAKEIIPQLEKTGHVTRGWLGVAVQRITPDLAETLHLEADHGALVAQVVPGSPAAKAGIEQGDVIVRFGDTQITKMHELPRVVSDAPVGKKVEIEVIRGGQNKTIEVTIAKLEQPAPRAELRPETGGGAAFGMTVADLTPTLRERLGVSEPGGAVITGLTPTGAAARAGLTPGDVILQVDQKPVENAADLEAKLKAAGDSALLLVQRRGNQVFVAVKRGPAEG